MALTTHPSCGALLSLRGLLLGELYLFTFTIDATLFYQLTASINTALVSFCLKEGVKITHETPCISNILTFAPSLCGRLRVSASLITEARSSLYTVFCRHLLAFISNASFSTCSNHLILGLPILFPSGLLSDIFLTTFP